MNDYQEIATAPGDLPQREIVRRLQTVRNQFRHENTTSPLAPGPGDPVRVDAIAGAGRGVVSAAVSYTTDGTNPNDSSQRVEMANVGTEWVCFGEYARRWTATLPGHDHGVTVRYRIVGRDAEGREVAAQDGQGLWYGHPAERSVTTFAYRVRRDHSAPDWFKTAVIYQIFVDRFRRPGGFVASEDLQSKHGGRINGITEQLPYLSELGVTCLWLSPIGPAPSYHRYDTTDYFAVDPVLGEVNDLRSLTDAAHERGMRVILDFVPCHLSKDHPAFVAAQSDPNAETREWFVFYEWPTKYRSFLDMVPGLVSLNTESRGVRDFLIESARFWIDCGIDGFRLDHVIGHGMDFWVEFQNALEESKADVVTIGEATDTGDALRRYHGRMNGILDFPLARALRLTFATGDWSVADLDGFLDLYDSYMTPGPARVSFLDNHDMDRFLYVASQDTASLRLAALCMMTLSQTPVLYYGTEIGMTHEHPTSSREHGGDALARQDMEWDASRWDRELLDYFKRLIALRASLGDVMRGERRRTHLDSGAGTYAYALSAGDRRTVVLFNVSRAKRIVPIVRPEEVLLATTSGAELRGDAVRLPARSAAVVRAR